MKAGSGPRRIPGATRRRKLLLISGLCNAVAATLAALAVLGYGVDLPVLIHVEPTLVGMAPLTAAAILALAGAIFASGRAQPARTLTGAAIAIAIAAATLIARDATGHDVANLWAGRAIFGMQPDAVGRTSIATAIDVILVAASMILSRTRTRAASDGLAGAALVVSGVALLGYFYGVRDLYAVTLFNTMALNTAIAMASLSVAAMLAEPGAGWAAVIGSLDAAGGGTRRQLAFVALPIVAGKLLLWATGAAGLGPALAMALLVTVTVFPLSWLVLRDGQVLDALDRERRDRVREQDRVAVEMRERLAHQAEELARESDERARVEAAMYRAQRMEAVGQLTGGIAHDFNNLLMAIRGNLELLDHDLPPGEIGLRRYVENATRASDKGARVTAQLLAFSRSQRLNIRDVELEPVLRGARELIGQSLGPAIAIAMQLDSAGAIVTTDPDQLELAILNLAVNSRDALPNGGHIRIETAFCEVVPGAGEAATPGIAIRVIDDGTGMAPEVAARAADPFFTTKERGRGTGLGLAQVYGFARQCGGDLRITSAPGRGTTVEILLRRAGAAGTAPERGETAAVVTGDAWARGRQVLVIDDDAGVRAFIVAALTKAGFEAIEADDGESGLGLLDRTRPAAAVIDFLMPGMNGAEVARRAQARRPGLPIVFVSGYSDTVALDRIAGAIVLRKPFDIASLHRALRTILY